MKKYFRTITALLPKSLKKHVLKKRVILHVRDFLFVFLALLIGVLLQILVILNNKYVVARREFEGKRAEYSYWETVVLQYPQIPDILYNAAVSALAFNRQEEALDYLNRALRIDPLFQRAEKLRKFILEK